MCTYTQAHTGCEVQMSPDTANLHLGTTDIHTLKDKGHAMWHPKDVTKGFNMQMSIDGKILIPI